ALPRARDPVLRADAPPAVDELPDVEPERVLVLTAEGEVAEVAEGALRLGALERLLDALEAHLDGEVRRGDEGVAGPGRAVPGAVRARPEGGRELARQGARVAVGGVHLREVLAPRAQPLPRRALQLRARDLHLLAPL